MARLSTIKEQKKKNRSGQGGKKRKKHLTGNKKNIKSIKDVKKAELDDDLFEADDGYLHQKYDDDGIPDARWLKKLMGEDFRVKKNVKGTSKRKA